MTRAPLFPLLALVCLGAGCGQAETPTSPTTVAANPSRTVLFSGTLAVGGSRFYSVTVSQAGTATFMLASVTRAGSGTPLPAAVGLGVGVPSGTDCAITAAVVTGAALTAQLTEPLQPGIYCAQIADVGTLTEPVAFVIRIIVP